MIIVYMFHIDTVLFEQDQQIYIIAYKILRYLCVRLTQIEAVDVRVSTHRKVFSDRGLLVTCHVIEDKNGIWKRLVRWYYIIIRECKIINFFNQC